MAEDPHADREGIDAQVAQWALDEEMADAVRVRRRAQRLASLADEDSTFRDLIESAARRGALIDITTAAGHTHLGRIEMVAEDHIRLRTARGIGLIALGAVAQLSERGGTMADLDPDLGPKQPSDTWESAPQRLLHAIERMIGTEVAIRLTRPSGAQEPNGEIEAVGEDYVVLRTHTGGRPGRCYARLDAVAEAWPFISG